MLRKKQKGKPMRAKGKKIWDIAGTVLLVLF